ncbi:MAG: YHS domain-containing (seleno)protein [Phormidesmis sp.]
MVGLAACSPTEPTASTEPSANTPTTVSSPNSSQKAGVPKLYAKDGVAIEGADPVAYFTDEAFVPGVADYTYEWQGATWQFASAENRDQFISNPAQYAPQYGGFCAWAVAAKNALVPIDPNAWSVVDGKLYLNANQNVQRNWQKDISGFIAKANENWPVLSQ